MCLPPDVIPSLLCVGKARGVNVSQWAVDQRPFVWAAASKPSEKSQGPPWASWADTPFYPRAPLPYAGIQVKAGGPDKPLEADSSLSLGYSLRASATTPVPKESLQSKVWEPRSDGREAGPAVRSFFCSPPSCTASGVETLQQSLSREGSVVSCTSSPRMLMPAAVQENSQSTEVPTKPTDGWESSRSKEERYRRSSRVEDLIVEDRMQNAAALKRKLSSGTTSRGRASRIAHHKSARHCNNNRPAAPKKDITNRSKIVSRSSGFSEEDASDDEDEGGPAVSEKRRKRMMSNRASAQRSRQRRQERLDTLEALVAELRVENAALTRRAKTAATAAKKFEEEIKVLRDRLGKQEPESNASNESDKTRENSNMAVDYRNGALHRAASAVDPRRNGSSDYSEETRHHDRYPRESSRPSRMDEDYNKPGGNSKRWTNNISSSSFDFDFGSDPTETGAATERGALSRATTLPENSGGSANVKDVYQSAMMSLAQTHSFPNIDPFGIDLEQYNQEMDKKNLDTRSEDDIWLESWRTA